jgi:hypothetical protein
VHLPVMFLAQWNSQVFIMMPACGMVLLNA